MSMYRTDPSRSLSFASTIHLQVGLGDRCASLATSAAKAPADLVRHVDLGLQLIRPRENQTRVLLEHAADDNHIESLVQELLGLLSASNRANSSNHHLISNGFLRRQRKRRLVSRSSVRVLLWVVTTGADVEDIDALLRQQRREAHRVVDGPGLLDVLLLLEPVGGADAQEQRHGIRDQAANHLDDFERETRAVLEAAAVLVGAGVGHRRQERVQQVAVGIVDLDGVETDVEGALDGVGVRLLEALDVVQRHLARVRVLLVPWDRGRGDHIVRPAVEVLACDLAARQPRRHGAGFAAGVRELDHDLLVLRVRELHDARDGFFLAVLPQADVFGRDAAFGGHGGGFDAGQAWSALHDAADVCGVPFGVVAVLGAVLAERRQHNAVLEGGAPDLERVEELWDVLCGLALTDDGGTCSWVLHWCEIWDLEDSRVSTDFTNVMDVVGDELTPFAALLAL